MRPRQRRCVRSVPQPQPCPYNAETKRPAKIGISWEVIPRTIQTPVAVLFTVRLWLDQDLSGVDEVLGDACETLHHGAIIGGRHVGDFVRMALGE